MLLAPTILVVTLVLVLARPLGLNRAWWAALGGTATVLTGLVAPGQAVSVLSEAADPLALLVGMMSLSAVAEKAGFFDWAASLAVRAGGGRVTRLFALLFVVGCSITAILSLDSTAIVLTPIVYNVVSRLGLRPLPFVFACVYSANTASLFLPISNLTNLLAYNSFDMGFARYALVMLLPATIAVLVNLLLLIWLFRRDLGGSYDLAAPRFVPENREFFRVACGAVLGVLAAFFVAPFFGVSVGAVALVAGVLVAGTTRILGWVRLRGVAGSVSWDVLVLVVGFFLVVRAAEGAGLGALVRGAYVVCTTCDGLPQILAVAGSSALVSNVLGNLPTMLVSLDAMGPLVSGGQLGSVAVYATVVGTGVGPNLTVVGSLAAMIWLSVVQSKGVKVTAREYLKVGIILTPPIVLAAAVGLWVSMQLFGP